MFVRDGGTFTDLGSTIKSASAVGGLAPMIPIFHTAPFSYWSKRFDGRGLGQSFFIQGHSQLHFAPPLGSSITIGNIADQAGIPDIDGNYTYDIVVGGVPVFEGSISIEGKGVVVLNGTNTYLGGTWIRGGSTLEIAGGTQLWGGVYVDGDAGAQATLILDKGERLGQSIVVNNPATGAFDTVPLVVDLSRGGIFSGRVLGLKPEQFVNFVGVALDSPALVPVATPTSLQVYAQQEVAGDLVTFPVSETLGAGPLHIGTNAQLQVTLNWIRDYDAAYVLAHPPSATTLPDGRLDVPTALRIGVDAQIGNTVTLGAVSIPTLLPSQPIVIENTGQGVITSGVGDSVDHSLIRLSGGSITLNPSTPLILSGGVQAINDGIFFDAVSAPVQLAVYSPIAGNAPLIALGGVELYGSNSFTGGLSFNGVLELGKPAAAGTGPLTFIQDQVTSTGTITESPWEAERKGHFLPGVLQIDGTIMPSNAINRIQPGDAIHLRDIAAEPSIVITDTNRNLVVGGATLHIGADVAPGTRFHVADDGASGSLVTPDFHRRVLIGAMDALSFTFNYNNELIDTFNYLNSYASNPDYWDAHPELDQPFNVPPAGTDFLIQLAGTYAGGYFLDTLPALTLSRDDRMFLEVPGDSRTLPGAITINNTLHFNAGTVYLRNITFNDQVPSSSNLYGYVFEVGNGATLNYENSIEQNLLGTSIPAGKVDAGGTLVSHSGRLGLVDNQGLLIAAPFLGQTVSLGGILSGEITLGDRAAVLNGKAVLDGGVVLLSDFSKTMKTDSVAHYTAHLVTNTTIESATTARMNAQIDFASDVGAMARIHVSASNGVPITSLGTIGFSQDIGMVDLPDWAVAGSQMRATEAGKLVFDAVTNSTVVSNQYRGVLQNLTIDVSGSAPRGGLFAIAPYGSGSRLVPQWQSATVGSELQLQSLAHYIANLPASSGALELQLSGVVALGDNLTWPAAPPGAFTFLNDAPGITGAFDIQPGASVSVDGSQAFTGGVTIESRGTFTAGAPTSAGSGGVWFAGSNAVLNLGTGGLRAPIHGFNFTDSIDFAGVTAPLGGVTRVGAGGVLDLGGGATLTFPDLIPGMRMFAVSDGHGGALITPSVPARFVTVHNEDELNEAFRQVAMTPAATEIVLSPPSGTITLTHPLNALSLPVGAVLLIEGASSTLMSSGDAGGLVVNAGSVTILDLTVTGAHQTGGTGGNGLADGYAGGAGGGAALGGGLFVGGSASVGLRDVKFVDNTVTGGAGGDGALSTGPVSQFYAGTPEPGLGNAFSAAVGAIGNGGKLAFPGFLGAGSGAYASPLLDPVYTYGGNGGGGGAGAGGAIFVASGGQLSIVGRLETAGNSASGGAGGVGPSWSNLGTFSNGPAGPALGAALYADGGGTITLLDGPALFAEPVAGGQGLTIAAGASASFGGAFNLTGTVSNAGSLSLSGGGAITTLVNAGGVTLGAADFSLGTASGGGSVQVDAGAHVIHMTGSVSLANLLLESGTLDFAGSGHFPLDFSGPAARLVIGAGRTSPETITGLGIGDQIDVRGIGLIPGTTIAASATMTLVGSNGTATLQLDPAMDLANTVFSVSANPAADGTLLEVVACFTPGTNILTPEGEVPVEALAIGDLVMTRDNGPRAIRWIGHRSYGARFVAAHRGIQPVRITAGALGEGLPRRDLLLSPNHALHFHTSEEGAVLINASLLVNDSSIIGCPDAGDVRYIHIELDNHDVIFAEGAEVESFVDVDCRNMFANAAEYAALYPDAAPASSALCAPRITDGFALEEVRAAIAIMAGGDPVYVPGPLDGHIDIVDDDAIEGWVRDISNPDVPVLLQVFYEDILVSRAVANVHRPDLESAGIGRGRHGFRIALPVWLCSDQITICREEDGEALFNGDARLGRLDEMKPAA